MDDVKISVVVPTYRRPALLHRCLQALLIQDCFYPYEIIVADDAGEEAALREVEAVMISSGSRAPIRYVPVKEKHGPAAARNQGWKAAQGEIVAFTDDDCIPAPDWLRHGIESFSGDVIAVWGRLAMPLPEKPTDYEWNASGLSRAVFVTANCFVRKTALQACGGFDENFKRAWREDSDLYFFLSKLPGKIVHAPSALIIHPVRPAPWGISVKQQQNNLYEALLYKKHPDLYREKIEPAFPWHYYLVVLMLFAAAMEMLLGKPFAALAFFSAWAFWTAYFCLKRLEFTALTAKHILEMIWTSVLIPPAAVFWRLAGAVKYRVLFL